MHPGDIPTCPLLSAVGCRESLWRLLAQLAKVIREAGELVDGQPRVDEQHSTLPARDDRISLYELVLMDEYAIGGLPQHPSLFRL